VLRLTLPSMFYVKWFQSSAHLQASACPTTICITGPSQGVGRLCFQTLDVVGEEEIPSLS